jgi:cytochrome c biogenesis protein CcmG/thiol:disulfide interchange protein DsbE
MTKLTRYVIPITVIILLGLLLWKSLSIDPHEIPSALIGKRSPTFNLPTLDNDKSTSRSDSRTHLNISKTLSDHDFTEAVSIVNIWASWCTACRAEHEYLKFLGSDPRIHLFGFNYKDQPEAALGFLQRFGNPYEKIGVDGDGKAAIEWGVYGTPETFIIDAAGIIRYKHVGPIDQESYVKEILPLIAELTKEHHVQQ